MRITVSQAKNTLKRVLNTCDDAVLLDYMNRACERLLYKGKWPDSFVRYQVCVNEGCLTWPRELETIEAMATCNSPGMVRNGWFEFLGSGPGIMDCSCDIGNQLLDRGNSVAFDEITGTDKKIAVYCDGSEDTSKRIILKYKNAGGNKVYTSVDGTVVEGESLALPIAGGYTYTSQVIYPGGLYGVIKPETNYMIRLYEYKPSTAALKPLAYYEPKETVPNYRSSFIGNLSAWTGECDNISVIVMGKKRFVPATDSNDVLMIPNLEAIRLAAQAIKKEESNLQGDAVAYWALAIQAMSDQLKHWNGDGAEQPIRMISSCVQGPAVGNLV